MNRKQQEVIEAKEQILEYIERGDTVYTVLRHVSASGMQRRIDLYVIKDNQPIYLSGYTAKLFGLRIHDKGGIITNGCGMDMGFHLVNNLSIELFCPDKYNHDEAYSLKHRWL